MILSRFLDTLNNYCEQGYKLLNWIDVFLSVKGSSSIYIEGLDRCTQFCDILRSLHIPILLLASEGHWQHHLERSIKSYQCLASSFNRHGKLSSMILSSIDELTSSLIKRSQYCDNVLNDLDVIDAENKGKCGVQKLLASGYVSSAKSRSRYNLQTC